MNRPESGHIVVVGVAFVVVGVLGIVGFATYCMVCERHDANRRKPAPQWAASPSGLDILPVAHSAQAEPAPTAVWSIPEHVVLETG